MRAVFFESECVATPLSGAWRVGIPSDGRAVGILMDAHLSVATNLMNLAVLVEPSILRCMFGSAGVNCYKRRTRFVSDQTGSASLLSRWCLSPVTHKGHKTTIACLAPLPPPVPCAELRCIAIFCPCAPRGLSETMTAS